MLVEEDTASLDDGNWHPLLVGSSVENFISIRHDRRPSGHDTSAVADPNHLDYKGNIGFCDGHSEPIATGDAVGGAVRPVVLRGDGAVLQLPASTLVRGPHLRPRGRAHKNSSASSIARARRSCRRPRTREGRSAQVAVAASGWLTAGSRAALCQAAHRLPRPGTAQSATTLEFTNNASFGCVKSTLQTLPASERFTNIAS